MFLKIVDGMEKLVVRNVIQRMEIMTEYNLMDAMPCKNRHDEKPHVKCGCGLRKHEHCRFCGGMYL